MRDHEIETLALQAAAKSHFAAAVLRRQVKSDELKAMRRTLLMRRARERRQKLARRRIMVSCGSCHWYITMCAESGEP